MEEITELRKIIELAKNRNRGKGSEKECEREREESLLR